MRRDIGSNFAVTAGLPALSRTAATYTTASVDHRDGATASFFISVGVFATSLVATLQYSDDNINWTPEPNTDLENDVSATFAAAGSASINAPNPRGRYSRLSIVAGGTNVFGVTSMLGPVRRVEPADAS